MERWVQIRDIMKKGKSLWFGGGGGTVLIVATHSSCHCPSPLSRQLGPSRCPSSQLFPYDKVYRSSQYKRPLTESLRWGREVTRLRARQQASFPITSPPVQRPPTRLRSRGNGADGCPIKSKLQRRLALKDRGGAR